LALVLEPVGEPGRLDLLPEVAAGPAAEIDPADLLSVLLDHPAAVVPRPDHQIVPALPIERLQLLVDLERAVEVLRVEPADNVEGWDGEVVDERQHAAHLGLPVGIKVGMLDEGVPAGHLAV